MDLYLVFKFPYKFNVEDRFELSLNKHMDKTNEWIKHIMGTWVKDMKPIMVVKRRGQNEHLKQGDEQKQIYILK